MSTAKKSTAKKKVARTTQPGYVNRNGQITVCNTDQPGNDHLQYTYQLACSHCGHNYGSNGSDIFERKCPKCQAGKPGLAYTER
jgi:anaerobic ribonucleoside-triphosphate reductase